VRRLRRDRVRLGLDPTPRAFVRSMAARERLGGLAPATRAAAVVLRTAFEWTLVETVGVGQSEIDVESVADSVVLVLQPGSGDTLQFMKAGILEIPDVLVVHKCDLGRVAEQTRRDLEAILALQPTGAGRTTGEEPGSWRPPVVSASAQSGLGVAELAHRLEEHRRYLHDSGELARRRERQRRTWVLDLFEQRFGTSGFERLGGRPVAEKLARTLAGPALEVFSQLASRAGFSA